MLDLLRGASGIGTEPAYERSVDAAPAALSGPIAVGSVPTYRGEAQASL